LWVVDKGLEGLTIRTVRPTAPGTGGRSAATAVLVAALVAGWLLAAWQPAAWHAAVTWSWPWMLAAAGVSWVVVLRPMLPGLALVAAGLAAVVARRQGADGTSATVVPASRS
jgi:hypothetical protein